MENDRVRRDGLLFSQRHGYTELPVPMRLEEISVDLRREIWNVTREILMSMRRRGVMGEYFFEEKGRRFIERVLGRFLKTPEDEVRTGYDDVLDLFKTLISSVEFHAVLDLVEIISDLEESGSFRNRVAECFERQGAAYRLDVSFPPFQFIPRSSEAQGQATREAIEIIRESGMDGADAHLRRAADHLNVRRFADSVRESIHAVESVARMVDPKAEKTLGPALVSLERAGVIKHSALKMAFSKLYGYTNDAEGIRHSLLDKDSPDVDLDEAMFMFGACASFAAYLVNKHRKTIA